MVTSPAEQRQGGPASPCLDPFHPDLDEDDEDNEV
jgi:hypothetical protein